MASLFIINVAKGQTSPCSPIADTCELVLNGSLEQHNLLENEYCDLADGQPFSCDSNDICNWVAKISSPIYCSGVNRSPSIVLGAWGETVVTSVDVNIVPGEEYLLSFEYCRSAELQAYLIGNGTRFLNIGLAQNDLYDQNAFLGNLEFLDLLTFDPDVDFNFDYPACFDRSTLLRKVEILIQPSSSYKKLYFRASGATTSTFGDFIHIRNISIDQCSIPSCHPEPGFKDTLSNCEVCFYGSNSGDPGTYHWSFGDGSTAVGQNVCHEYIRGGNYQVCLEIICDGDNDGIEVCEVVNIPQSCTDCDTLSIEPVLANRCDTSDYLSSYKANFRFKLPQTGLDLCPGSELKFLSDDADITTISYEIQRGAASMDDFLKAEIEIDPYDATLPDCSTGESIIASFVLCDTDTLQYCYSFPICAQNNCEECLGALTATADCDESASFAGNYVYTGSLTFNTNTDFTPGIPSTQACGVLNFPYQGSLTYSGTPNIFTFEYTIFTRDPNFSGTSATLCVVNGDNDKNACIEVDISIGDQCDEQNPEECDEWLPKSLECTSVDGSGNIIYNMDTDVTLAGNYQICPGGVSYSITSPASIVVNSLSVSGNTLSYDIDIVVPPTYNPNQIYTFEIILCNAEGEVVCLRMYFWLEECDPASLPRSSNLDSGNFQVTDDEIRLVPNPANSYLKIVSKRIQRNQNYHYSIVAMNGAQSHFETEGRQGFLRIDLEQFNPGIYIVKIWNEKEIIGTEKLVIAR